MARIETNNNKDSENPSTDKLQGKGLQLPTVRGCRFSRGGNEGDQIVFCVRGNGEVLSLSEVLPVLENMGVSVLSASTLLTESEGTKSSSSADSVANPVETESVETESSVEKGSCVEGHSWQINFLLHNAVGDLASNSELQTNFRQLFVAVIDGLVENDGFNRLISKAEMNISELVLLRAIAKYLSQIKVPFSQIYMAETLTKYSLIASSIVALFSAKFAPGSSTEEKKRLDSIKQHQAKVLEQLEQVVSRDEDRILRSYLSVLNAMLRTNFYQLNDCCQQQRGLSFKLSPADIEGIPQPVPKFEVFVYSPRVEGVHLRGGKVSRGGIRWSDRKEDYRTEVLGLAKAQMVKNAVIVPVGAKGGFVVKGSAVAGRAVNNAETTKQQVVDCYSEYIRSLLDITDNLKGGEVVPPINVVRYDDDDPYLVVAADKGTAVFSDVANAIAKNYEFWLGDAFASGGANGYDHKKMGITALGAWESTKRLFKELGIDSQNRDFTAVGIGDMSGDVFGNGMLLSEHIRLIGAFNHLHIFIDPNPDASTSYLERKRLFELPQSSWEDYQTRLISAGGGVFSRRAKSIELSPEIMELLRIPTSQSRISPDQLIQYLLKAPVELLWNGGIGTYIKASDESDLDVGDRANDAVRVSADQLHTKIVVEGGNLGLTQKARIQLATNGGLVTTDAIDNSGGVDCSDHEVNIKILLQQLLADQLIDDNQRNQLLDSMTADIAELVLKNNYQQSKMLSQSNYSSRSFIDKHLQLIQLLEKEGTLNRQLEYLPDDAIVEERIKSQQGLTRPEIAVLLAYSKTHLYGKLVNSDIIDDDLIREELYSYFPSLIRQHYPSYIQNHPLRKEILAAQITNQVANRMGATFCNYLLEENKTDTARWVKSYTAVRRIFGIADIVKKIEALGMAVSNSLQMELHLKLHYPVEKAAYWLLNHADEAFNTRAVIERYQSTVDYVRDHLQQLLTEEEVGLYHQNVTNLTHRGVPLEIAEAISSLDYLYHGLDIAEISTEKNLDPSTVVATYYRINGELDLFWLRRSLDSLPLYDKWYRKAKQALSVDMDLLIRELVQRLLQKSGNQITISRWSMNKLRYQELLAEIKAQPNQHLAMIAVAIERIGELA
ncbi:hypothetical protein BGP75_13015 [Motiliproteus sp. MSK22-1]|nr:hypothetical protein BGP75_13015 [Motiliproteus sp. MSK22-1]